MSKQTEDIVKVAKLICDKERNELKKLYCLSLLRSIDNHRKELSKLYDELKRAVQLPVWTGNKRSEQYNRGQQNEASNIHL